MRGSDARAPVPRPAAYRGPDPMLTHRGVAHWQRFVAVVHRNAASPAAQSVSSAGGSREAGCESSFELGVRHPTLAGIKEASFSRAILLGVHIRMVGPRHRPSWCLSGWWDWETVEIAMKVGFMCTFVAIDFIDLGATIVVTSPVSPAGWQGLKPAG